MATKNVLGVLKAVGGVLTLALTYLGVAIAADWPPFGSTGKVTMDFPGNGYRVASDFHVELSGSLAPESHLWVAARDSNQNWYPLVEAVASSKEHWRAEVRSEQIVSAVDLCAVRVDDAANGDFARAAPKGQRLATPPDKADQLACAAVQPVT